MKLTCLEGTPGNLTQARQPLCRSAPCRVLTVLSYWDRTSLMCLTWPWTNLTNSIAQVGLQTPNHGATKYTKIKFKNNKWDGKSQVWWNKPIISTFRRLKKRDLEDQHRLHSKAYVSLKKKMCSLSLSLSFSSEEAGSASPPLLSSHNPLTLISSQYPLNKVDTPKETSV